MPKTPEHSTIILGIDPGLADTGFGIVTKRQGELLALDCGTITTAAGKPIEQRLDEIHRFVRTIIKHYQPTIIAVEKLFFSKNTKTATAVGQARGVILLAAGEQRLVVAEYTPLEVKQALTSYGRASKQQVQQMVARILRLNQPIQSDDAADALAVAICCAHHHRQRKL